MESKTVGYSPEQSSLWMCYLAVYLGCLALSAADIGAAWAHPGGSG